MTSSRGEFDTDLLAIEDYRYVSVAPTDDVGDDAETLERLQVAVAERKEREAPPHARADITRLPEVVDDFIRNFLVKRGMLRTLDIFEAEWYELFGLTPEQHAPPVPEAYLENTRLLDELQSVREELANTKSHATNATQLWEGAKKERDFHRTNHARLVQEKGTIAREMKRLQAHAHSVEPTIAELRSKYEQGQKERMILKLERDKHAARVKELEERIREMELNAAAAQPDALPKGKAVKAAATAAESTFRWPADERPPSLPTGAKVPSASAWSCRSVVKGHTMSVTHVAVHPRKPIVASSSDDGTWRLCSLPQGDLILSGEGHRSWIAGIALHPRGTLVATASGDKTVKVWDIATNACRHTLKSHSDSVWAVSFQDSGELLASASMDHSTRIWDVQEGRCRQTLRGHVDSVNTISWLPCTNSIVTGSSDKTISMWDVRTNCCVQTYYGHQNSVSGVDVRPMGDSIVSCDADGLLVVWDARKVQKRVQHSLGPNALNGVAYDYSGSLIAAASDDASVKLILPEGKVVALKGHSDAVQHVAFDISTNGFLVSASSDATIRYWA